MGPIKAQLKRVACNTSGLDFHNTMILMECLHHLTEQHSKSIVISIHQPSSEVMAFVENNKRWAASPIITLLPFLWQCKHISQHSGLF